jgi:hypothetical protein
MLTESSLHKGFTPRPGVFISQFSFRDVLQAKNRVGQIDRLVEFAHTLGYEYILWNDRVYFLSGDVVTDTGFTSSSVF